jgi:DNA repair protein RadC
MSRGLPSHLILDPLAPIPPSLGKRDRFRLGELREAYQASMAERFQGVSLTTPEDVAALVAPIIAPLRVESLLVISLNTRNKPMGPPAIVSRGDYDGTDVPIRVVLRTVLVMEGTQFVIAHNHPTGDPAPSGADTAVTTRLVAAGRVISCPLRDHIIIGSNGRFVSLLRNRPELWS